MLNDDGANETRRGTMTITHIDELLLAGDPHSMNAAAQHATQCEGCAHELAMWRELSSTALSLRQEWPSDTLLPRIQRAIAKEAKPRRHIWWQIAAAVLLTVGLAAVIARGAASQRQHEEFDRAILQSSAIEDVERTERAHRDAINRLEKQTATVLEQPSSPLLVSYKEKLVLLDDAIGQCETAIQRNRGNAHLREQLLAIYSEKQRTLEELVREEKHVTSE